MSIQQVSAYRVGELVFPTIREAQKEELISLLLPEGRLEKDETLHKAIDRIIEHTDEIVAILTCQPKSKAHRKPRSDIGKKRVTKVAAFSGV